MRRKTRDIDDDTDNLDSYDYYKFYLNVSRSFGLIWFILTVCFTVALVLVYIQPDWIGDTNESASRGYFGIYQFCVRSNVFHNYECSGEWNDFDRFPYDMSVFKASNVFILIAIILSMCVILVSFVSLCVKFERIFHICSWIQFIITICLFIGITIYPAGWNSRLVRSVCGMEANQYRIGSCGIRWPYIVASMLEFQILLLTIFAILLSSRQAKYILAYSEHPVFAHDSHSKPRKNIRL